MEIGSVPKTDRAQSFMKTLQGYAALLLIVVTLALAWFHGSTTFFVPCVQDCGETFIAQHAVVNYRLYGVKYGLLQDHATIPEPDRHPFLYTHNVHLGTLLFPLLDQAGLTSLWAKQLVTLFAFGAGLLYLFLTVRYVTRSSLIALTVLLVFCTEYAQVFTFALNTLRAWHWLALFGLIYHALRFVSAEQAGAAKNLIAMTIFTVISFGIGYDFLAISGLVTVFVALLCSRSLIRTGACLAWLGCSVMLVFIVRQIQVITVLGFDFWYQDLVYSAVIKVTALAKYFSIPSMPEIEAFYQAHGIFRPWAAAATLDQIVLGLRHLVFHVTLPTAGFGAAASWLLVTILSVGVVMLWAVHPLTIRFVQHSVERSWQHRLFSGLRFRDGDWIDANLTARFFVAMVLGVVGGFIGFGSITLSIYLKHQFPLTAAVLLIPKGVLIALLIQCAMVRRRRLGAMVTALALAIVLIVVHVATQVKNWVAIPPMSVAWIAEVLKRQDATYAVSWIPSSVAGFARNWVVGIQPGREIHAIERANHGEAPFTDSDLLEFNPAFKEDIEKYHLLRPDYWLYFSTDQKLEFQGVVPSCNRSYARRLFDNLVFPQNKPRLASVNFEAPAGVGTFAGELNVTGRAVAAVEVLYGEIVLARVGLYCDYRKFAGVLLSLDFPADGIPVKIDAITHNGRRYHLGESRISLREQREAKPPLQPRRQPSAENLIRLNRALPIAATGPGFVLFDLRPFWKQ